MISSSYGLENLEANEKLVVTADDALQREDLWQRWGGGHQILSNGHRSLWWDHDVIRHAEPSPVKLHEVKTRNNRCGATGSAPIDGVMKGC